MATKIMTFENNCLDERNFVQNIHGAFNMIVQVLKCVYEWYEAISTNLTSLILTGNDAPHILEAPLQIFHPGRFLMVIIVFSTSNTMGNHPSSMILMKVIKFWEVYCVS